MCWRTRTRQSLLTAEEWISISHIKWWKKLKRVGESVWGKPVLGRCKTSEILDMQTSRYLQFSFCIHCSFLKKKKQNEVFNIWGNLLNPEVLCFQDKYYDLAQAMSIQKFLLVTANYSSAETMKGHNKSKWWHMLSTCPGVSGVL